MTQPKTASKFTPGPWETGQARGNGQLDEVMAPDGAAIRLICQVHAGHRDERFANARLIAAAPEMYELLESLAKEANKQFDSSMDAAEVFEELGDEARRIKAAIDG